MNVSSLRRSGILIWVWLKIKWGQTAGFGPCFHLPGFDFGTGFLSHSHIYTYIHIHIPLWMRSIEGRKSEAAVTPTTKPLLAWQATPNRLCFATRRPLANGDRSSNLDSHPIEDSPELDRGSREAMFLWPFGGFHAGMVAVDTREVLQTPCFRRRR